MRVGAPYGVADVTKVVVHPAGSDAQARRNWAKTLAREVDLHQPDLRAVLTTAERNRLATVHPNGRARVWGTHHGNANLIARISAGDLVLFTAASTLRAVARVGAILDSSALGDVLWPPDPVRGSYRHVYTLTGVRFIDATSYDDIRRAGGLTPEYPFRNFAVLDDDRAARLLDAYGDLAPVDAVQPRRATPTVEYSAQSGSEAWPAARGSLNDEDAPALGTVDVAAFLDGFEGPTDSFVIAVARREQAELRRALGLGKDVRTGRCGLCGRTFPAGLLVAAHIKRRSECSEDERRDPNVAMLACTLGCDALFEVGYVSVAGRGRVVTARRDITHAAHLDQELRRLSRQPAPAWSAEREPYFAWHREHRFLGQSAFA